MIFWDMGLIETACRANKKKGALCAPQPQQRDKTPDPLPSPKPWAKYG